MPTPAGISDDAFRSVVQATDTFFRSEGRVPTTTELVQRWPNLRPPTVSKIYTTPEFQEALELRGVLFNAEQGLTEEQQYALLVITNPTNQRSLNSVLKDLNIPIARWQAWMKHPLFAAAYRKRSEDNLSEAIPMLVNRVVQGADAGKENMIRLGLEMTGRWNPARQEVEDAKIVVSRVIEAVIKRIPDPALRQAILDDIRGIAVGYDLTHQPAQIER